ncbi:MAG TPA: 1-phosphofructokinase family hexose kinase [Candidatus Hydrogenedentes bacterium]|nr:1-phosphofructokinase family hexose kinase [Candidatus Hydrogenedentota bacterium]
MILTVTPNPCVDKTVFIDALEVGTFMRSRKCACIPGGKGTNVARAVHALGRPSTAMVLVGGHPGAHVVEMIEQQDGVPCVPVWVASQTRTITTVFEEPIHRQTAFFEPGSRVTEGEADAIVKRFEAVAAEARVVTFNGTVPDPALRDLYRRLIPIAKMHDAITILDSHGPEFALGLEAAPYMIKPNVVETEESVGYTLDSEEATWRAMEEFHERGVELVVLSLGKDGALVSQGSERLRVTPPAITEVNPVGSGDALVAGFAIGLLEGMPLDAMARLGVAMGTANAMSWDIGHFTRDEVEAVSAEVRVEPVADC